MKKLSILSLMIIVLMTSCTKIVQNFSSGTTTTYFYSPEVYYYDGFPRPNTPQGYIGLPQVGNPYTILGAGLNYGNALCSIQDNRLVVPNSSDMYLIEEFGTDTLINYAGATFRWEYNKGTNGDAVIVFLMGDMGGTNIASKCLHIRVTRTSISFDVFNGDGKGAKNINTKFYKALDLYIDNTFEFFSTKNRIYYSINGSTPKAVVDDAYKDKIGRAVCFEVFHNAKVNENTASFESLIAGKL